MAEKMWPIPPVRVVRVSGSYNRLDFPGGSVIPFTQRSSFQLAEILLGALGMRCTANDMPATIYPPTEWASANAANALAELCHAHGRDVLYDPVGDSVRIVKRTREMTMADHAEAWARERGETVPARDTPEWNEM